MALMREFGCHLSSTLGERRCRSCYQFFRNRLLAKRDRTVSSPSTGRSPAERMRTEQRMLADLENTRAEPGALQFHIHRDRFDPNVFVIYEVWKDLGALRRHFDMPYVRQFVTDSADYVDGNMEVQWLVMASEYVAGH